MFGVADRRLGRHGEKAGETRREGWGDIEVWGDRQRRLVRQREGCGVKEVWVTESWRDTEKVEKTEKEGWGDREKVGETPRDAGETKKVK